MWIDTHDQILTDLYRKPETKCQYLLPDSAHPRHCFPGIAKSLTHRVVGICSQTEDREKRLEELKDMLLGRGYKVSMLNEVMAMARDMDTRTGTRLSTESRERVVSKGSGTS